VSKPTAKLDPYTLRYVARRMRKYERYYGDQEHVRAKPAAFAAGIQRMARKAADECLGTARALTKPPRKPTKTRKKTKP
jgi:hypothetical protein